MLFDLWLSVVPMRLSAEVWVSAEEQRPYSNIYSRKNSSKPWKYEPCPWSHSRMVSHCLMASSSPLNTTEPPGGDEARKQGDEEKRWWRREGKDGGRSREKRKGQGWRGERGCVCGGGGVRPRYCLHWMGRVRCSLVFWTSHFGAAVLLTPSEDVASSNKNQHIGSFRLRSLPESDQVFFSNKVVGTW